jgi:hypothetical protein
MGNRKQLALPAAAIIVGTILIGGAAWACNVPVFRYAIERWRPDPYRVVLLHRGELTKADRELLRPLRDQQDGGLANLAVRTVDVDDLNASSEDSAADKALWEALGQTELPLLVVHYPQQLNIAKPVWASPAEGKAIANLADSPVRRELIKRLAAGQTAVWLLLDSGEAGQDDPAAALIEQQLKKLEQELELPELTATPEDELLSDAPLKIEFSLLRVRRDDPAEAALVAMLIGSEADLAERTDPMVFPIYGRGRALWGLIGPGITENNIRDSAEFLVGPCSCQVKEQNPGFDLLLAVDWDVVLSQSGFKFTAAETKVAPPPTAAELVPIPAGSPTEFIDQPLIVSQTTETVIVPTWWIIGGVGGIGLLVVLAIAVAVAASQGSRQSTEA